MARTDAAKKSGGVNPSKKTLDAIKEATGASEEDISAMLSECGNDVNEATARLIESM
jgi:NACalpha-BTF3-like transcription factor